MVPVEATARDGDRVSVLEAFPVGRHVGRAGEDVAVGNIVLLGRSGLAAAGYRSVERLRLGTVAAVRQPIVTILITGDELLPPGTPPTGYRFADMNSPMLVALVERDAGLTRVVGPTADRRDTLREALADACRRSDLVLVSGGSSTGPEDHAPGLLAELGELPVHGVALRPASPTGLGFVGSVPVLLLPGNPVSCLCAYDLFGGRIVRRLGGRPVDWPYRSVRAAPEPQAGVCGRASRLRTGETDRWWR